MLIGFALCVMVYLAVCGVFPCNRTRHGGKRILLALMTAGILCDALWFLMYFPGGEYQNYGIGGSFGVLLCPVLFFAAGVLVTAWNKD